MSPAALLTWLAARPAASPEGLRRYPPPCSLVTTSRRDRKTTVAVSQPPSFSLLSLHCTDMQWRPLKGKRREWELGTKMQGATRASLMPLSHQNGNMFPVTLMTLLTHLLVCSFVYSHGNESSTMAGL